MLNRMFLIIKYHFEGFLQRENIMLGNSQTFGLKKFWSYPVKTLHIHVGK